jgi:hypothetical protein
MRDLIKFVIKEYTQEKRVDWIKEHCNNAFGEQSERYFCYAATNAFKNDYELQKTIELYLKMFVNAFAKEIMTLKWQKLTSEHKIAEDGIKELEWVKKNGKELCPEIEKNIKKILSDLNNGTYVYYADPITGEYHLLNRLDTNYSALAVMVTEYFRQTNALEVLKYRIHNMKNWEIPAKKMIEWLVNPDSDYPIPLPKEENLFKIAKITFDKKPLSTIIFKDLISNLESGISRKTLKVLQDVREVGFNTERKFIRELEKYGIDYVNFGRDYGFVDRKLGIDLFVKLSDGWYPVQVKSSEREKTLITQLGCEGSLIVYPNDKGDFMVGNSTFERYFCKNQKVCKESEINSDETNQ